MSVLNNSKAPVSVEFRTEVDTYRDWETPKTIKITGEGKIPFQLFAWIQVLPVTPYQSKIRITLHAELNMMMKMIVGKKLNDGVNKIAEALTMFPYR